LYEPEKSSAVMACSPVLSMMVLSCRCNTKRRVQRHEYFASGLHFRTGRFGGLRDQVWRTRFAEVEITISIAKLLPDLTSLAHERGALGEILASSCVADTTGEIANASEQDLSSNVVRQRSQSKQRVSVSLLFAEWRVLARVAIESGRRQLSFVGADAPDPFRLRPERWLEPAARADG
jgi:hypothetical protein